ncbi:ChbG/HpnK family deacetylase [Marinobacterium lutimaris]|uniref:Predicted glycoside hydrolase or deacetylase ChbG, UPF0249 family n=1 Tax=Marinobacterium lutimaris TaxID=568106 RepID=A0A1H6DDH2_9GAMM|nr:ChbG/HpnK family deacetylase [Marinobacterium lutimaris]SEG82546.1 Predicted glycoside hydrolase or deacetylase ChbG, UPF0249 family [Marinobacterium lutimaris]
MSRTVVICADDFGMSEGINQAILELIDLGRLSATSCMTNMLCWTREAAEQLQARRHKAALGLHFNLTEGVHAVPLGKLMLKSLVRQLDRQALLKQFDEQLDSFEELIGSAPDFVDGHQHIQMFPVIRELLLDRLQQRYGKQAPWVRASTPRLSGHDSGFKAMVLRLIGLGFESARRRFHTKGSAAFAGLYSLSPEADFAGMMQLWLNTEPDGVLIMCHPGKTGDESSLARARRREYEWLSSDLFIEALRNSDRSLHTEPTFS